MAPTEEAYTEDSEFPALQDGRLRLYSMRLCPFAQRTRLVLAHKKIPKPSWFLERNPLGKVPALEKDGHVIYESAVTCDYLDEVHPENKLNPTDPYEKARDKMLLEFMSPVTSAYYTSIRSNGQDTEAIEKLKTALQPLESALGKRGDYFGGSKVGMLDYMFWPHLERVSVIEATLKSEIITSKADFPKLAGWYARMLEEPAVKETFFSAADHIGFYMTARDGEPNYNYGL